MLAAMGSSPLREAVSRACRLASAVRNFPYGDSGKNSGLARLEPALDFRDQQRSLKREVK